MKALWTLFFILFTPVAFAQSQCQNDALQVLKNDPLGTLIYNTLQADEKSYFLKSINCKMITLAEITQGVFESSRRISNVHQVFILPDLSTRGTLRMPLKALKPSAIAERFDSSVLHYSTLVEAKNFQFLLSALNAQAVAVKSAINLTKKGQLPGGGQIGYREQLASLMLMVKLYLNAASKHKETWDLMKDEDSHRRLTTAKIWVQAAQVMREACQHPNLGIRDLEYLELVYSLEDRDGLQQVLGGAFEANMPVECREINR